MVPAYKWGGRATKPRLWSAKDRNDLGIHTEVLNPGLVDLIRRG